MRPERREYIEKFFQCEIHNNEIPEKEQKKFFGGMVFKDLLPDEERVMKNLPPKAEDVNFVVKNYPELYNSWQSFDPNFKNLLRDRVNQVEQEYKRKKEKQDLPTQITQTVGGVYDLTKNYLNMESDNTKGNDKYFHCKANCEASQRGLYSERIAEELCNGRESFQKTIKQLSNKYDKNAEKDTQEDQEANVYGRNNAWQRRNAWELADDCENICKKYRVKGINKKY